MVKEVSRQVFVGGSDESESGGAKPGLIPDESAREASS